MWRSQGGKRKILPKPEEEIKQLIDILTTIKPDILGVCEIGSIDDLYDLQSRLKQRGVNLPYLHLAQGSDDVRRQGLLSAFTITANKAPIIEFPIDNKSYKIHRGILDATVKSPLGEIRFIGIHLKSKRKTSSYDQEYYRNCEAFTVKQHLKKIHSDPSSSQTKVLVFGDFNDNTQSTAVKTIIGSSRLKDYCRAIPIKDKYGLSWTYNWAYQDIYSRFDYVLANRALYPLIDTKKCEIYDTTDFPKSSDHRPLTIKFKDK